MNGSIYSNSSTPLRHNNALQTHITRSSVGRLTERVRTTSILLRGIRRTNKLLIITGRPPSLISVQVRTPPPNSNAKRHPLPHIPGKHISWVIPRNSNLNRILIRTGQNNCTTNSLHGLRHIHRPHTMIIPLKDRGRLHLIQRTPRNLTISSTIPITLMTHTGHVNLLKRRPTSKNVQRHHRQQRRLILPPLSIYPHRCKGTHARTLYTLSLQSSINKRLLSHLLITRRTHTTGLIRSL